MAWVAFQKSNWTRTDHPTHARQYFPASVQATMTGGLVFTAGGTQLLTITAVAFQFQGNGPVHMSAPEGTSGFATAAAAGVSVGNAWLQGPVPNGAYSLGNHPQIVFRISSSAAYTTAATGFDLIAEQY
jgi:hypothetical protein